MGTYAESLVGIVLDTGWTISKKLEKASGETGGNFSVQYIAERNAEKCFLKAIDIEKTINSSPLTDLTTILQKQTEEYNYERDLLLYCKEHNTSKVVLIREYGMIPPNNAGMIPVPYLTFDLADGNVKSYIKFQNDLDFAWKLKSLHDIANGLQQLHNINIIHQDVKPSNILQFKDESKLTDLGRSKCTVIKGPYDNYDFSGDWTYAPLEILPYFAFLRPIDWYDRNLSMDSYLLGNLMTFYFTGLNMTAMLVRNLKVLGFSDRNSPEERMAYVNDAFAIALEEIRSSIKYDAFADDIVLMISQLCCPYPDKRNDEKTLRQKGSNYALYRYITKLDLLSRRAEINLKQNGTIN